MLLRWIYRIWRAIWIAIMTLLVALVIAGGALFLSLQTGMLKAFLAHRVENAFNANYEGRIKIGEISGLLPFDVEVRNVTLSYPDKKKSDVSDTVFQCDTLSFSVDVWELLSRRIKVTSFDIRDPEIDLHSMGDSTYTLFQAIKRINPLEKKNKWLIFKDLNIYAPILSISNAKVKIDSLHNPPPGFHFPHPLVMNSMNLKLFLELSKYQRFLDIGKFEAKIPSLNVGKILAKGQIFNDSRFLEFNRFRVHAGKSHFELNGEIDGVNIYIGHLWKQLNKARYKIALDSTKIYMNEFSDIYPKIPPLSRPILIDLNGDGDLSSFSIRDLDLAYHKSRIEASGTIQNLNDLDDFGYDLNLARFHVDPYDLSQLSQNNKWDKYRDLNLISATGKISGNTDSLFVNTRLDLPKGKLEIKGKTTLRSPFDYSASVQGRDVDLSQFHLPNITVGSLNLDADIKGVGVKINNSTVNMRVKVFKSRINSLAIQDFNAKASLVDGLLQPDLTLKTDSSSLNSKGWVDFAGNEPEMNMKGSGTGVDLQHYFGRSRVSKTNMDFKYHVHMHGVALDSLYGMANFDVSRSIIRGDTLSPHQLYIDISSPKKKERTLRFTSTVADLILKGQFKPTNVFQLSKYWVAYFQKHISKEIALQTPDSVSVTDPPVRLSKNMQANFSANLHVKDISLLRKYIPEVPAIITDSQFQANIKADSTRLLLTGGWNGNKLAVDTLLALDPQMMISASFKHNQDLNQFANLNVRMNLDSLSMSGVKASGVNLNVSMKNDSVVVHNVIRRIGNDASLDMVLSTQLMDTALVFRVQKFEMGDKNYRWKNEGHPVMIYDNHNRFVFRKFRFKNDNQLIHLQGAFSNNPKDSVIYSLQNINLQRIANLVNSKINFEGTLNARFSTKSLTKVPSIQGNIFVNRFAIDNRPVGDINFTSKFDPPKNRFNTVLSIKADTAKYHTYYVHNDSVATNILVKGYIRPPDPDAHIDTLYHFNMNFKQIDMWVLNYIIPNIFTKIEGRANGKGFITGNLHNYNFHANFFTHNVLAKPMFLNSNLYLTGPITLDKKDGVEIDSVRIHDKQGGTGLLYGNVDLNHFQEEKKLDLTLKMNKLKFLNNKFSPDVPFYGSVIGSGTVRLTGTNLSPFLQSLTPITTTSNSKLDIPLLDQTKVQDQSQFIQFVHHFSVGKGGKNQKGNIIQNNLEDQSRTASEQSKADKSFTQLFQLDLRFIAPQNSTVEFIFDPVTGEVLTAKGGGQVNITLEDQNLQMFGRFDITGGDYLFVGGEVFSRKFYLENGGTISWDGDPVNPRINITSVYRARPNIQPITNENRRVPINLILKLTGNIKSVKNDFYFQFPNSMDIAQNSTVLSFLNSQDQKLIQATSLLLTGGFSTVSTPNGTENQALGYNIQNKATQVGLSQLLSNQINTLLNSSLSDLDIDLNMNGFNQADLGIALRLFNDKLVLRREGVIGGGPQYSTIGDLGAQYQINPHLSVEVFHRQDPTLSSSYIYGATSQLPSVNGLGLKYQVQFNTWKELPRKIFESLGGIFGKKKKKKSKPKKNQAISTEEKNKK